MRTKILLLAAVIAFPLFTMANNIRVVLNSYNPTTKQLKISLAWDNSWHDGSGQFRDAAWLFVKYKDITNSEWQHAILTTPTTGTNSLTDTLNSPGVKFDLIGKNLSSAVGSVGSRGYIIRRQKGATAAVQNNPEFAGGYNVAMPLTATIVLPTGMVLANPEFRVYALEMVDIPSASFYAGDGGANSVVSSSSISSVPLLITQETTNLAFSVRLPSSNSAAANTTFPKGKDEFYMMKYELSSEGYAEFLNTLTRTQQNTLIPTLVGVVSSNFSVNLGGASFSRGNLHGNIPNISSAGLFTAVLPYIPFQLGSGSSAEISLLAYLDWSGLRPMSGFEYEKACRGPVFPVVDEFAWGSASFSAVWPSTGTFQNYGTETETIIETLDGPINTDVIMRCGIFAKGTGSNRFNSGGTYYGVMDMSNNAMEITAGYTSSTFNSTLGDGKLSTTGEANTTSWVGLNYVWKGTQNSNPYDIAGGIVSGLSTTTSIPGIRGVIK